MSKEIFLYSEDKKYKCAVELSDSLDQFKCPDHSVLILFEERENGTYIIAQSRDKRLETEKDQKIADLEAKLAEKEFEHSRDLDRLNEELKSYKYSVGQMWELLNDKDKQLAEKEGKIETLKQRIDSIVKIYSNDFVSKDTELKELRHKVKQHNQDKISFCIEKLTDIRSFVSDATEIKEPDYTKVCNYIEKQIEELKKEK